MKLNINEIIKIIPHTYPFLLVDKVIECKPTKSIIALKNVTFNEQFFIGHFPGYPIMPGVLIIEALAQASAICMMNNQNHITSKEQVLYFMSIEKAKFRTPVIPGDSLVLQSNIINARLGAYKFECVAYVNNKKVTEAKIIAMLHNISL
ncbi:3-hydroxyacyl-ACP dehydratase FabZ [Wolbachia endosymbiont of Howardula sp.]|uniref:3-hydroxyacyl-ACP dehydratase FabZ n=1 Tax=Wolbachia endosymbiont of Howardula sp. TaxID=2916816 RepID=UPI00217ED87F|nr:3-hydroxyacyl-ACP dehydratase FabZ [Wolbachia endosymbiont of Howardula sp.]UWI83249.1 3-hydroxyacyl-ACP dehydratase FabZ [Wolbachia endosymbiont of Howardula sp.]